MKKFALFVLVAFGMGYSDLLVRPSLAHNTGVPHLHAREVYDSSVEAGVEAVENAWDATLGQVVTFIETTCYIVASALEQIPEVRVELVFVPQGPPAPEDTSWDTVSYPTFPSSSSGSLGGVFQKQEADYSPAETIIENDMCSLCATPHPRSHPCSDAEGY